MNRGSGEPEVHSFREGLFDCRKHLPEGRAMAFVDYEHHALFPNRLKVSTVDATFPLYVAHLLDGRNDERISRRITLQAIDKHIGILGGLHVIGIVGEIAILS